MHSLSLWQESLALLASKGTALFAAALVAGLALCGISAARRYCLWLAAAAAATALPFAMPLVPAWRILPPLAAELAFPAPELENVTERPLPAPVPAVTAGGPAVPAPVRKADNKVVPRQSPPQPAPLSWAAVLSLMPAIWLGIAVLLLFRVGLSGWRLRRLEKHCLPLSVPGFQSIATEAGLGRLPVFLLGPSESVPMVWGIFRPRLLLPKGFQNWPPNQLRCVLLHEFAHLRRRDPASLCLAQFMLALNWFNPLAWLLVRCLRADQERSCDDSVLRHGVRPSEYAQHLLNLSRHTRLGPGLGLCALAMARAAPVESRITAILDPRRPRDAATRRWSLTLVTLTLLLAAPLAMLHALDGPKLRGRILDRNGIVLAETTPHKTRNYPLKALTPHMIGYVTQPAAAPERIVGAFGMEKQLDAQLADGKPASLTLDARVQQVVHHALREAGATRAAVVIIDPRNGEVLSMLSFPHQNPNAFIPRISIDDWKHLVEDPNLPLLDRTVHSGAPGAAFIPVTALSAIASGRADELIECTGSVRVGNAQFRCWIAEKNGAHGLLDMQEAITRSCNCYWREMGGRLGLDPILKTGRQLGLGAASGVLPKEDAGVLPDMVPSEKTVGSTVTANLAVGQGMILTTPMQMAVAAAAIANGGKVPQPTLLRRDVPQWRTDLALEGRNSANIESIRRALLENVNGNNGTGRSARSDKYLIAGATGTTQQWRRLNETRISENNGWFIGFAPYDRPVLAFAIFIQGVKSGGGACAPIAKRIVEETLALPADGSGEVEPIETSRKTAGAPPAPSSPELRKAGSPRIDPTHEKRWRWLQKLGDLHELPEEAQDLRGGLQGTSFPRSSTLSFQAPRQAVREWLRRSPGYQRYQRAFQEMHAPFLDAGDAHSIQSSARYDLRLGNQQFRPETVAMRASTLEFLNGPATPVDVPAWPDSGRITVFCSTSGLTHCTIVLDLAGNASAQVTVQATANPARIQIAE